jgi:hypothetical protein
MKPVPFAQYLARQQQAEAHSAPAPVWPPRPRPEDKPTAPPRKSPLLRNFEKEREDSRPEPAHRLEQGHLKAFEEGRDAARREWDDERDRLKEGLDAEIAKARALWAAEEGARLAEAHRAAIEDFETRCAQAVADILRPFLVRQTIARVTQALIDNIEALLAARAQGVFEISGPPDLLDALRDKFAARGARMAFTPGPDIDVRLRVEDTVIETQLEPWLKALGALPVGNAQGEAGHE